MLVTKEKNIGNNAQASTSSYLNSQTLTQSTRLSMKFNESLLISRTNPHLNRVWEIDVNGIRLYYTTPDNVFHNTNIRRYFKQLLGYQRTSGIIEPNDISDYKYRKLYSKFKSLIKGVELSIPNVQKNLFINILQKLASSPNVSINDLNIQISADNELVVFKKGEVGTYYIVLGDEENDVSYLYISNTPGVYTSLHTKENISLNQIIEAFSAE